MPLLDDPNVGTASLLVPRGFIPLGVDEETHPTPPQVPSPANETSFIQQVMAFDPYAGGKGIGAAARINNNIGSAIAKLQDTWGVSNELTDPNYSPWEDVQGTPYEEYWKSTFVFSNNAKYTEALKRSIDRQENDRRTVDAGGAFGTVAGILAGAVDPTLLLPVGGEITLAEKGVWTVAKGALSGARAGGLGAGAYELGLQSTQDIRTPGESVLNISTGIVLGAVLGGTIASALTRTQRVASEAALERLNTINVPGTVGAAAAERFTLDDMMISGTVTRNVTAATAFSPVMRGNFRESPLAVQTYYELVPQPLRMAMHTEGETLGLSVETNINTSLSETYGQGERLHPQFYADLKKAGISMSKDSFDHEVGQAMNRGDVGPNEIVSKAAAMWRSKVVEPLTKQAIDLGMLPEDVKVTEAPSYFSRVPIVDKMIAEKPQFIQVVTDHFNEVLQNQYQKAVQNLTTRQADLAEEISNMKLSPEDRAKKLEGLAGSQKALEEQMGTEADIASQIKDLRGVARKAKESGDEAAQAAAEQKISALKEAGGEEFQTFKKEEAKLKKQARQINLGYAGLQEKADTLSEQLTDLSHNNFKSLQRLVKRGQQLATQLKKLDPEKLQTTLSDLRSEFYALITRSERSQDRLAKQIEKLRVDEDAKVQSALAEAGLNKEKLNKTEQKKAAKIEKEVRATNTAITDRLAKGLEQEKARTDRISKISDRLQAAEAIDNTADLAEIRNAVDSLTLELSNKALGRGERAVELQARLAKLDPKKIDEHIANLEQLKKDLERSFYDKWEIKRLGEGVDLIGQETPDFTVHAKDMAQQVYDGYTGSDWGSASVDPQFQLAARSGPLKDRTFHIPDEKIDRWMEKDITKVMSRFSRKMAAQIELQRKFPQGITKRLEDIKSQYDALIDAAKTEKERLALTKDREGALRDLKALTEIHMGNYKTAENSTQFARSTRALMVFNFIRSMGGSALPSISDLYNPAIFHGMGRAMEYGVPGLVHSLEGVGKLSRQEAELAVLSERIGHHRLLTLSELGDPYKNQTSVERLLENGMKVASKWSGLQLLTDVEKRIDAEIVMGRLNTAMIKGGDTEWVAYSGISSPMRDKISKLLQEHHSFEDGRMIANTDRWNDFDAVRAYRGAVNFNVDMDIVTRGKGDLPLKFHEPIWKAFFQFKTFNLGAHQRTMLRAMQLGPAQFLSGLIGVTTLGMFTAYLKAWRSGSDGWERFKKNAGNPGFMVGEGMDNTGFFTLPLEVSDLIEKGSAESGYAFNPIKTPLMLAGREFYPDASIQGASQRYAEQSLVEALSGPTGGLLENVVRGPGGVLVDVTTGKPISKRHRNAANQIVPYQSYYGMREMMQILEHNSPYVEGDNQ